ncbi:hypothetical protein HXX76_004003 [Chlamydomonas incerta]|uniref:Glycosyltransferase 61 catalytic domain-containing protein n=1 Tax=Chlamydomonas incerta TaxID=51695 RepID=A0A835TBT3_CHLIN|nr:hypothetical protein HXX76_004003 [Chlamydomonas incerta]|eukprot:KAG2441151.1 hypothetical protein HXX76_004003 [Chlamydomonas incerta]
MRHHSFQHRGGWSVSRFRSVHAVWVVVLLGCAALLALNSARRSSASHHSRLLTQLENFEQSAERLLLHSGRAGASSPPPAPLPPPPEVELALRSRKRFAEQLGLRITDSAAESPFPEPPNGSTRRVLQSAVWRPKLLRQCTEDTPPYYAPCLPRYTPSLLYGEEVVYPDFEAALPGFFNATDAAAWLRANYASDIVGQTGANRRVMYDARQARLVFSGLRGQNLVFGNVRYADGGFPTSWNGDSTHCLGHMVNFDQFRKQLEPGEIGVVAAAAGRGGGNGTGSGGGGGGAGGGGAAGGGGGSAEAATGAADFAADYNGGPAIAGLGGAGAGSAPTAPRVRRGDGSAAEAVDAPGGSWSDMDTPGAGVWVEEAAVYVTPDSDRYQHFLDHTVKVLMQTQHLISNNTLIIPGGGLNSKQRIVQQMWGWMDHIDRDRQVLRTTATVRARRLLTACRVPYVHPYLFLRLQESVLGPDAPVVPLESRKVVLWYSRTGDDPTRGNSGRSILNEEEVQAAIRRLLVERGRGERLEIHPAAQNSVVNQAHGDPKAYARWINQNVAAMIGPHGGGLCNIKWLAGGSLVLEFMPRDWLNVHFYEESTGHGLNYWLDIQDPVDYDRNMRADTARVLALLRQELGKPASRGPLLRQRYDWPTALRDSLPADPAYRAAQAAAELAGGGPLYEDLQPRCCSTNAVGHDPGAPGLTVLSVPPEPQAEAKPQAEEAAAGQQAGAAMQADTAAAAQQAAKVAAAAVEAAAAAAAGGGGGAAALTMAAVQQLQADQAQERVATMTDLEEAHSIGSSRELVAVAHKPEEEEAAAAAGRGAQQEDPAVSLLGGKAQEKVVVVPHGRKARQRRQAVAEVAKRMAAEGAAAIEAGAVGAAG